MINNFQPIGYILFNDGRKLDIEAICKWLDGSIEIRTNDGSYLYRCWGHIVPVDNTPLKHCIRNYSLSKIEKHADGSYELVTMDDFEYCALYKGFERG